MEVEEGINRFEERQLREDIIRLKKRHRSLEKRMEELGNQRLAVIRLAESLGALMANIESTQERIKSLWNPDTSTRIKMMKKESRLYKDLNSFDIQLAKEYEKGNVQEEIVKKFVAIIVLLRQGNMPKAKMGFRYFDEMIRSSRESDTVAEELEKRKRMLIKERHKIQKLLVDISDLEKETVDLEKVRSYEKLLKGLESLKELRLGYLRSLKSKPLSELLSYIEGHPMSDKLPDYPGMGGISELRDFFSEYPALGNMNTAQICEFFNQSEKKVAHICPETSRFKKSVLSRRRWFEILNNLGQTPFLAIDHKDRKVMDFFAMNIDGAEEVVGHIRSLSQEEHLAKEEYEKNKRIRQRKEELSGFSKNGLVKGMEEIESLLQLLHSDQEDGEEKRGLISRIKSYFSR